MISTTEIIKIKKSNVCGTSECVEVKKGRKREGDCVHQAHVSCDIVTYLCHDFEAEITASSEMLMIDLATTGSLCGILGAPSTISRSAAFPRGR